MGGGCHIVEAWVNGDPEQFRARQPAEDAALLMLLIDVMLLKQERPSTAG